MKLCSHAISLGIIALTKIATFSLQNLLASIGLSQPNQFLYSKISAAQSNGYTWRVEDDEEITFENTVPPLPPAEHAAVVRAAHHIQPLPFLVLAGPLGCTGLRCW